MILRDYQTDLVAAIRAAFRDGHRMVIGQAPTGAGKTVVYSYITQTAAARGYRVCLAMHRQELIRQTSEALGDVRHGIIRGGVRPNPYPAVQVASVQTLANRTDRYDFDLLIIDEAHHCCAASYRKVLAAYPNAFVLGVTATPERLDGRGLGEAGFTCMVEGPTTAQLIKRGYLSPIDLRIPPVVQASGVGITRGDFNRGQLAALMDRPKITGDVIAHYKRYCNYAPAIAFCVSVAHAEHVAEQFRVAGYSAASIDGKMTDGQRRGLITDLGSGGLHVLCSCDLISEGVDVPVVEAGLMLRHTQSLALWLQQVGRCLRTAPGKSRAVILDHVGNTLRGHGLPTDDRQWTLDGVTRQARKAEQEARSIRVCDECLRPHEPAPLCPFCGYQYPVQSREIVQVDGELEKVEEIWRRTEARRSRAREEREAKTLEDLVALGKARNYPHPYGWAKHKFNGRQRRTA